MRNLLRLGLGVCVLTLTLTATLVAQRELSWDELAVTARLDADGVLDVAERHTMVFTGDWNGGERLFNVRPRQKLEFLGMERLDATGAPQALRETSTAPDNVDEFAFANRRTLRWRSRLPSDPPFTNTRLTYVLHYKLSGILLKDADHYQLNHDFAFPDRVGSIARFSLNLSVDPGWQPLTDMRQRYTAGPLAPGQSFVLTIPLRYVGAGAPIAFDNGGAIVGAVAAILGAFVLGVLAFFMRERALGRFASTSPAGVDAAWIEEHILTHPPELIARNWKVQPVEVFPGGKLAVSIVPTVVLGLAGAVLFGWIAYAHPESRWGAIIIFMFAAFVGFLLQIPGGWFRSRTDRGVLSAAVALLPAAIVSAAAARLLWFGSGESHWASIAGLAAWVVCISNASIDALKSRQPAEAIAFRRRLARGRRFFKAELRKPNPALRDSWSPWLRALGVGRQVNRWSTRFGRTSARTSPRDGSTSDSLSTTASSSAASHENSAWTGGGGRSGGAGGGSTWAAATAWMAAAVSVPKGSEGGSGGDGGSSDSGSSSGGGGGGGW